MKLRAWIAHTLTVLVLGAGLVLPASAQHFPIPSRGGSASIGVGDIINIIGAAQSGRSHGRSGVVIGDRRGQDRTAAVIGLAGILYDLSRQGGQHGANQHPGRLPSYEPSFPAGYPDYQPGSGRQPDGYSYIEHYGRPIRLDPRILPLTINAGARQGEEIVAQAVSNWNTAGVGQLFALTQGAADLSIDWSGAKVSQGARAETRMLKTRDYVVPTDISVRTSGRSPQQLVRIMTHELGHVLGLDHSRDPRDIMYVSEQNGSSALTNRDLAMVGWLYSQSLYAPVVGMTDLQGVRPSVASNWASHRIGLSGGAHATSCGW